MNMTQQEIFDKVTMHLLRQGKKSQSAGDNTTCLYRGPDGTSCAVGCLIKDEFYFSSLENLGVDTTEVIEALRQSGVMGASFSSLGLLNDLQKLHDYANPSEWKEELSALAKRWGLSPGVTELGS
jgi:hypothetical protein